MRVRPGLLVVLPLLLAVPAAAAVSTLTTDSAPSASAPAAAPRSTDAALLVAAIAADSAVQRGAASESSAPAAAPRAAANKPAPKAESATLHAATRTAPRRLTAARTRTVAAAPAPASSASSAPRPAAQPATTPTAQPAPTQPSSAPVATGRDDYPYRTATTNSYDEWGFTKRQCVSFVAWRLAQAGRPLDNRAEGWGSALTWDEVARERGKAVSTRPVVGAVAHWNAGEGSAYYAPGSAKANGRFTAGGYGHVGWVTQVFADGSAQVEQYNSGGDRSWSSMRVVAPRYLSL